MADIQADIYSLGCTLYYLLTGRPPFQGASLYDLLQAHLSMDAQPLNLVRPEVPAELAALVAKMMAKDRDRGSKPSRGRRGAQAVLQKGGRDLEARGLHTRQSAPRTSRRSETSSR